MLDRTRILSYVGLASFLSLVSAGSALAGPGGTTLSVTKTGTGALTQTNIYTWTVQKTTPPNQATYVIPVGSNAPVPFTITATRSGPVSSTSGSVSGSICVTNTGTSATEGLQIIDTLEVLNGATWTPVPGGQVSVPVTGEIPVGPNPVCYPYQINGLTLDPAAEYRNDATVSIDNYSGHEGTSFPTDAIIPITVTPTTNNVDATATLGDTVTCPTGFTCTETTLPTDLTDTTVLNYTVTATNATAACGQTLTLSNQATLTPDTTQVPQNSSASVQIFTGTCAVTAYSGRAWVAGVTTPILAVTLGDTGELSPTGVPPLSSSLASGGVPGILSFGISTGNTSSTSTQSSSNASLAALSLSVGPLVTITADSVQSQTSSSCADHVASSVATSTIANLRINGVLVTVTGAPNQVVALPLGLGSITINQQVESTTQPSSSMVVNAIDVSALGIVNASLSHSESDITCN